MRSSQDLCQKIYAVCWQKVSKRGAYLFTNLLFQDKQSAVLSFLHEYAKYAKGLGCHLTQDLPNIQTTIKIATCLLFEPINSRAFVLIELNKDNRLSMKRNHTSLKMAKDFNNEWLCFWAC